ncbi:MAG TPA: hypothetical protein VIT44_13735 [Cyclobacteriaceae bacterium]
MAKFLLLVIVLISTHCLAQSNFQKGYFIDNNNQKHECYIKDNDWLNIPETFKYRLQPDSEELSISVSEVKEFKTDNNKYIRAQVDIDNSSSNTVSQIRKPEFTNEALFLKVLVEGKANLYYSRAKGEDKFFFNKGTEPITQLIYKRYFISNTQTGVNNDFQNQLKTELNCRNYIDSRFQSLRYDRKVLENFFVDHNQCMGDTTAQVKSDSKSAFHLKITPGIDFASMKARSLSHDDIAKFDSEVNFRIGAEFETVLPFNRNKWALFAEPVFQSYSSTSESTTKVDYKSLELGLGPRHYFVLNTDHRLFLTGLLILDFPLKHEVSFPVVTYTAKSVSTNLALGAGYNYKKLSIECRYYFKRTNTGISPGAAPNILLDYKKASIILGYRIF